MRLQCFYCLKFVSTEFPDDMIFRATVTCPECEETLEREGERFQEFSLEGLRAELAQARAWAGAWRAYAHFQYKADHDNAENWMRLQCAKAEVSRLHAELGQAQTELVLMTVNAEKERLAGMKWFDDFSALSAQMRELLAERDNMRAELKQARNDEIEAI